MSLRNCNKMATVLATDSEDDGGLVNDSNGYEQAPKFECIPYKASFSFCNKSTLKVFYFSIVASLASFQYGTTTVFSSPLLIDLQEANLTQWKEGFSTDECAYQVLIGPISPIAAIAGGLLSAPLTAVTGLVTGMILTAVVYVSGWTMLGCSYFITSPYAFRGLLLTGRALTGFAMGFAVPIVLVYIAEISPPNLRGRFSMVFQIFLTCGLFTAYLLGGLIGYWKSSFVFSSISLLHVFLLLTVQKSPNRSRNPIKNMQSLRQKIQNIKRVRTSMSWSKSLKYTKVIVVGTCTLAFQQITGLSAILYYVGPILDSAGWNSDTLSANTVAAISIGIVQMSGAVCTFFFIDRLGRRIPLFFGAIGIMFANIGIAVYFGISFGFVTSESSLTNFNMSNVTETRASSCIQPPVNANDTNSMPGVQVIPILCFLLFFVSFSVSWASISWAVAGELYPWEIRGLASGISGSVNRVAVVVVTFAFPAVSREIGFTVPFLIFAALSLTAAIFVVLCIPETCKLTLDEIGDMDINMLKNAKEFAFLLKSCCLCQLCKKCYKKLKLFQGFTRAFRYSPTGVGEYELS